MRSAKLLILTALLSVGALAAGATPAIAGVGHAGPGVQQCCMMGHLHARMVGGPTYPAAYGHADYWGMMYQREIEVEVYALPSLAGQTLTVYAAGIEVGTAIVDGGGNFYFDRQGSGVPYLHAGDTVLVQDPSGTLVASGTLKRHRHHCCSIPV